MSARSTDGAGFLRARRPEQKEQRAAAILAAARDLALRDGVGAVSLAAIATRVGVHKSALLKYFGTREEIFLRLSETEWLTWADAVVTDLTAIHADARAAASHSASRSADGHAAASHSASRSADVRASSLAADVGTSASHSVDGFGAPGVVGASLGVVGGDGLGAGRGVSERLAEVLGRSVAERPLFCQLLMHSSLTLERNVSLDALRRSKVAATGSTDAVADAVHRLLPDLPREACFELVAATGLVAAGLWQAAHPPPVVVTLYAEMGDAGGFARLSRLDLAAEVSRFARVFLAGLRTEPEAPRDDAGLRTEPEAPREDAVLRGSGCPAPE